METGWNHNIHYHNLILKALPLKRNTALDIGCGEGLLLRQLSPLYHSITGIDANAQVITQAVEGNNNTNIQFILGDVMDYTFPQNFDLVASVATLHHLPLTDALIRFRGMLNPGSVLVIIGLYKLHHIIDYIYAMFAMPLSRIFCVFKSYRTMIAPAQEPKLTLMEIKKQAEVLLPGCIIKRRLFFRYSLVWVNNAD